MTTANVHQAKTNLSKLLNAAADGEDVIITRRGGKVTRFKLTPVKNDKPLDAFGILKGKIQFADNYDQADKEIEDLFYEHLDK